MHSSATSHLSRGEVGVERTGQLALIFLAQRVIAAGHCNRTSPKSSCLKSPEPSFPDGPLQGSNHQSLFGREQNIFVAGPNGQKHKSVNLDRPIHQNGSNPVYFS